MNGVQTRFKCKLDVKRCKRFVFPPSSLLPRSNALKTKAIRYFQTDRTLTRIVSPPLDTEEEDIVRRQDGSMLVEASMNIKDFMEEMGILSYEDLEDEDFTTLGGLAMFLLGGIPKAGDIFTYKNLQFEVVDMDRGRVDKLLVIKRDEE